MHCSALHCAVGCGLSPVGCALVCSLLYYDSHLQISGHLSHCISLVPRVMDCNCFECLCNEVLENALIKFMCMCVRACVRVCACVYAHIIFLNRKPTRHSQQSDSLITSIIYIHIKYTQFVE